LAAVRMSIFAGRLSLALGLAVLCPGPRTAYAQAAAVTYSSWPIGFHSNLTVGQNSNIYGSFAGFDGGDARAGGFSATRINFPNGWFVGSEGGGINQAGAFGRSLNYEGAQFGYNFQGLGGLPVTVYAGLGALKYNTAIGGPLTSFDNMSGTLPGYSAHAGVEFQPAPNVSLSLELGYTQQPGDANSLSLPGASPLTLGGRR
jgi:opacity protein-like surface antigen